MFVLFKTFADRSLLVTK